MTAPLVSIIIPVFNRVDYLGQALTNVQQQTHPSVEIVVVDDGSTEDVAATVANFPAVQYVSQTNQGPSAARNHGISLSHGEYLAFLDSDDLWRPEKIERQVGHLLAHLEIDIVYTRAENFVEPGHERPPHLKAADIGTSIPCIMTMLLRRSFFDSVGGFARELTHGEDTDWIMRARDAGVREHTIDEVFLDRRIHDSNLSSNVMQSRQNAFQILRDSIRRKREQQQGDD